MSETMLSASQCVLGVYELLENILLRLPRVQHLVQCQRVCRTWSAVIRTSTPVQEHLFYRQPSDACGPPASDDAAPPAAAHPAWTPNPVLEYLLAGRLEQSAHAGGSSDWDFLGRIDARGTNAPPHGSWQHMFATSPPSRCIKVCTDGWLKSFYVRSEEPWRLGALLPLLRSELKKSVDELGADLYAYYDFASLDVGVRVFGETFPDESTFGRGEGAKDVAVVG